MEVMNTPDCPLRDRAATFGADVCASPSQADILCRPDAVSWLVSIPPHDPSFHGIAMPNNAVVPDQKLHDSPSSSEPLPLPSLIRPITHPSTQSFPIVPTITEPQPHFEQLMLQNVHHQKQQEQLTQLQLQLVQSQQRKELELRLLLQMEQQRQLLTYYQQQQQHILAPQDILPFQQPALLDNGRWGLIQPWLSMVM